MAGVFRRLNSHVTSVTVITKFLSHYCLPFYVTPSVTTLIEIYREHIPCHYSDGMMSAVAFQITSLTVVYPTVYSGADLRKYQSSASLAFGRGIHRWPVNSPHRGPVTRKVFPFDDVIMCNMSTTRIIINHYPIIIRSERDHSSKIWTRTNIKEICSWLNARTLPKYVKEYMLNKKIEVSENFVIF